VVVANAVVLTTGLAKGVTKRLRWSRAICMTSLRPDWSVRSPPGSRPVTGPMRDCWSATSRLCVWAASSGRRSMTSGSFSAAARSPLGTSGVADTSTRVVTTLATGGGAPSASALPVRAVGAVSWGALTERVSGMPGGPDWANAGAVTASKMAATRDCLITELLLGRCVFAVLALHDAKRIEHHVVVAGDELHLVGAPLTLLRATQATDGQLAGHDHPIQFGVVPADRR